MSTIIRRKRTSSISIGPYKRHELLTGEIVYPMQGYTGYSDGHSTSLGDFISNEMHADWEANRDELMAFWKSRKHTGPETFPDSKPWLFICGDADTLPWAATKFDDKEKA
jgi:hypothetical protein